MTHDDAVQIEGNFFADINDPYIRSYIDRFDQRSVFFGWWLAHTHSFAKAITLSDMSMTLYSMLLAKETSIQFMNPLDDIVTEHRKMIIKELKKEKTNG